MKYSDYDTQWLGELNWLTLILLLLTLPITLPLALIGIGPGTILAILIFAWCAGLIMTICQYLDTLL